MRGAIQKAKLYAICDLGYLSFDRAVAVSRQLLEGGAGVLQLRAKGADPSQLIDLARQLRNLCEDFGVPFIVNDHGELALEVGAHGLHLGQDDGSFDPWRKLVGGDFLFGRSTHSIEQVRGAIAEGVDYFGFGPLYPTPTKEGRVSIGLGHIREMEELAEGRCPGFCIGGIQSGNLSEVINTGAKRVVVVSHLLLAACPRSLASEILKKLRHGN